MGDYDDNEESDFECPECMSELDEDDCCPNEECEYFECEPPLVSDRDVDWRREERRQMGITS